MMYNLIPVQDHPHLFRSSSSRAIINKDRLEKKNIEKERAKVDRIINLENRLSKIEKSLNQILSYIKG